MQDFLKTTIRQAGVLAEEYFEKGVDHDTKSEKSDLITEADIAVSDFIVKKIQEKYPDHHIKSEELADEINKGAKYEWVIDPIEGTRNFAMGVAFWAIMIAVMKDGEAYLGAIYNPISDQLFFAQKDKGAYLNEKQIYANNTENLDSSFGCFTRAYEGGIYGDYIERYRTAGVRLVMETKAWMHNYGCILSVCHLASGGIDFVAGNAGMDWDYLAPFLIAQEAGAIVTDSDGNPWQRDRQDFVVANKYLHPKVMELFQYNEQ